MNCCVKRDNDSDSLRFVFLSDRFLDDFLGHAFFRNRLRFQHSDTRLVVFLVSTSIIFLLGCIQNTCPSLTKQASVNSTLLHPDQLADNLTPQYEWITSSPLSAPSTARVRLLSSYLLQTTTGRNLKGQH